MHQKNRHPIGYTLTTQTDDGPHTLGQRFTTARAARQAAGALCRQTRRRVSMWALYAGPPHAELVAVARWDVGGGRVAWERS